MASIKQRREQSTERLYFENSKNFFKMVEEGEVYEYYFGHFLFGDVKRLAAKYNVELKYLKKGHPKRKSSYSFLVTKAPEKIQINRDPLMFDVTELAI